MPKGEKFQGVEPKEDDAEIRYGNGAPVVVRDP